MGGPAKVFFNVTTGLPSKELRKIFDEWVQNTGTKFEMDPLGFFPLCLFAFIEGMGADDIRNFLKGKKEETIEGAIDVFCNGKDEQNRVRNLWKLLTKSQRRLLLIYANKKVSEDLDDKQKKALQNEMKKKYKHIFGS